MSDSRKRYTVWAWLYGRALGAVFLVAFASLGSQLRALVGEQGLVPAVEQLARAESALGAEARVELPTLAWFGASDASLVGIAWLGAGAALLLALGVLPAPSLAVAVAAYVSLINVGGPFLRFQWDILLVEAGFSALLVVPLAWFHRPRGTAPPPLARFVIVMLLVKLVFLSGFVKLASDDPTWADLSALRYHYFTQPLPNPLSYYAHQLPSSLQRASCFVMFAIELGAPLAALVPVTLARRGAALSITGLMLLILATGNYGFFNLLAIALCLPLLDDALLLSALPARVRAFFAEAPAGAGDEAKPVTALAETCERFGSALGVTLAALLLGLESAFAHGEHGARAVLCFFVAGLAGWQTLVRAGEHREEREERARLREKKGKSPRPMPLLRPALPAVRRRAVETLAVAFLAASAIPFAGRLSEGFAEWSADALSDVRPFHLFNSYGLFAVMTTERREIIIEGSTDGNEWKPYELWYKPGSLDRTPPEVLGHMPRVDWQLWFAALGNYRQNPWLITLMQRLAQGNPDVLARFAKNPFSAAPPRFVRARIYDYRFTTFAERSRTGNVWARGEPEPYSPTVRAPSQ